MNKRYPISLHKKIEISIKKIIAQIVFFFLYRGMKVVVKVENKVKTEIESWEEGFSILIKTDDNSPSLYLVKENEKITRKKMKTNADILISFKSLEASFLMLTGRMGVEQAYAQHRFSLKGDITKAMSVVRCIDIVEAYLFPRFITKHILKEITKRKIPILLLYIRVLIVV